MDLSLDLCNQLIALFAPRGLFINSGNVRDARGMYLATVAASPVYTLLGKKGLSTGQFPAVETGVMEGDLTFRQHNGGHTPGPNWPIFIQFAERYFAK